jgi:hypothetical protein
MLLALMVTMTSWAQGISGTVFDDQGEPVIGASVVEKANPQNGTITDFNGNFTIKVNERGRTDPAGRSSNWLRRAEEERGNCLNR